MVQKVMIGVPTEEYGRRADFYDHFNLLQKPDNSFIMMAHKRSPAHNRNLIIEEALKHECTHILFIDDDMVPEPGALYQLLRHDKEIVTGLYLRREYPHQPLIFDVMDDDGAALYSYLPDGSGSGLKEVVAAGMGFVLMQTDIFEKLEKPYFRLGELVGAADQWCDDIGFFFRAKKAGIKSFCDMECRVGHIGSMIIQPNYQDDKWYTGYNTGTGMLNTPQIMPDIVYTELK